VVDSSGRLIAHPDISLVLRNTDLSALEQVKAARVASAAPPEQWQTASDVYGRPVLTAHAAIAPLDWHLFVELPFGEAYAPVYASLLATGLVLLAGLVLAVLSSLVLSRRMVRPIHQLQTGAAQIGAGALDHRIRIATGDELQALGEQFNSMAAQLEQSYATLERKVDERTKQLQLANLAKSRFLAAASHDLRQPLHALGLFVAQLRPESDPAERTKIVARIDTAVSAMNELFNALLDISKLDADQVPDRAGHAARRVDFRGCGGREGTEPALRAERRMGVQRLHPAGAGSAQSGVERSSLHRARGRGGRRTPARNPAAA
jgi:signal transduction histidine kinase